MKALLFGKILWDIIDSKPYIGGAPFNLAAHLTNMGFKPTLITSVGNDVLGRKALREVEKEVLILLLSESIPICPLGL